MNNVVVSEKIPIKCWCNNIEQSAIEQAKNLANLPFAFKHIALMPDCHTGFGMPIGGVLATNNVLVPGAVGVDIGCGMAVVKTNLNSIRKSDLEEVVCLIKQTVPVGTARNTKNNFQAEIPDYSHLQNISANECFIAESMGTLGGGNHFIEIQQNENHDIYIMVHCGSRGIGYQIGQYYTQLAAKINARWFSQVDPVSGLSFLPFDTPEGQDYWNDMSWCINFAQANRQVIVNACINAFYKVFKNIQCDNIIDVKHNYADFENHFGKNVIVHRKGATRARLGDACISPGSMGTYSVIGVGLGNKESFCSCSHGAGRQLSRTAAKTTLDLQSEIDFMNKKNIIHNIKSVENLDEAPHAYKNIDTVLANESDLVQVVEKLYPMAVIKG